MYQRPFSLGGRETTLPRAFQIEMGVPDGANSAFFCYHQFCQPANVTDQTGDYFLILVRFKRDHNGFRKVVVCEMLRERVFFGNVQLALWGKLLLH